MLKKLATLLFFASLTNSLLSQAITFHINGSEAHYALIYRFHGSKTEKVDSLPLVDSNYIYKPGPTATSGEYLFSMPGKPDIHFLYTGSSFTMQANYNTLSETVDFISSTENEVYREFLLQKELYNMKKEELENRSRLRKNSNKQEFFATEIAKAQAEFWKNSLNLAQHNPGLLATTIIKASVGKETPATLTREEAKKWKQEHFWDNVDLTDPRLEFTEIGGRIMWNYLELFFNKTIDKESQEAIFKEALNKVFGRSDIAENLVLFWANDLFNTFSETDYDGLTTYLWDGFIQSRCSQVDEESITPADIEKIKATAVGQKAYDFTINADGKKIVLSGVNAKYTLVLFWASWCPHCIHELPMIKEIFDKYRSKGFAIIGISVDYDKSEYEKFLKNDKIDWPNTLAAESWQSELCKRYNVTGTPKMVLVDKNLTIISKPTTPEQLEAKLVELLGK